MTLLLNVTHNQGGLSAINVIKNDFYLLIAKNYDFSIFER